MKKSMKFLAFLILGLFAVSMFAGIVSAKFGDTGLSLPQFIKDWQLGNLDPGFAKLGMFVIICIFIILIIENMFPNGGNYNIAVSVIVAFLATAYITPQEVLSLMLSYTALGLTITTLIPLILLFGLTYQAAQPKSHMGLVMLQWFAWILYLIYTMYKVFSAWGSQQTYSGMVAIIIFGSAIAAFLVTVFNRQILHMIAKRIMGAEGLKMQQKTTRMKRGAKLLETMGAPEEEQNLANTEK